MIFFVRKKNHKKGVFEKLMEKKTSDKNNVTNKLRQRIEEEKITANVKELKILEEN